MLSVCRILCLRILNRRAMGMRPIVIDGGEAKKKISLDSGAEEFVDFTQEKDCPAKVIEITGGIGAHGVVVTAYQAYKGTSSTSLREARYIPPSNSTLTLIFRRNEVYRIEKRQQDHGT